MTKKLFRIRKDTEIKEFIASFSERKIAEKIANKLEFKTFIEEVLLDGEGKVIKK